MTTIPGHNIVIQQAGRAHDATHHNRPSQPDPQHLLTEQTVKETAEQTTVQTTEEQSSLQTDGNAQNRREALEKRRKKKKKKNRQLQKKQRKDGAAGPGALLDTVV